MKHLKITGLAAVAVMALMAFAASSASATALYNGNEMLGPESIIDFSIKPGTSAKLTNTPETETLDTCTGGTVKGKTTNTGSSTETVKGTVEEVTWSGCSVPTSTDTKGELEIHWISSTTNGTVTAAGEFGVTINTIFFGTCKYGVTTGNHLGVMLGSSTGTAELNVNAIAEKLAGSEAVCPLTAKWVATYVSTAPDHLAVEES